MIRVEDDNGNAEMKQSYERNISAKVTKTRDNRFYGGNNLNNAAPTDKSARPPKHGVSNNHNNNTNSSNRADFSDLNISGINNKNSAGYNHHNANNEMSQDSMSKQLDGLLMNDQHAPKITLSNQNRQQ